MRIRRNYRLEYNIVIQISDKRLISRKNIYMYFSTLNSKNRNQKLRKWAKDKKRHPTKEDIHMVNKHINISITTHLSEQQNIFLSCINSKYKNVKNPISHIIYRNIRYHSGKQFGIFTLCIETSNYTPGHLSQEIKTYVHTKSVY